MIGVQREQDFRDDIEVVSSDGVSFQFNEVWTGTRLNQKSELIVNQIKSCHQPCLAWPVILSVIMKKTHMTSKNLVCFLFLSKKLRGSGEQIFNAQILN